MYCLKYLNIKLIVNNNGKKNKDNLYTRNWLNIATIHIALIGLQSYKHLLLCNIMINANQIITSLLSYFNNIIEDILKYE